MRCSPTLGKRGVECPQNPYKFFVLALRRNNVSMQPAGAASVGIGKYEEYLLKPQEEPENKDAYMWVTE
jgi:hypothetical protein